MTSHMLLIAMYRAPSVRSRDANDFLHVDVSNISKVNVDPHLGREIPATVQASWIAATS